MRHIRIINKSVPLMGTSRHRGQIHLPNKHGLVKGRSIGGAQMMLMEPEISEHGLQDISIGMSNIGLGLKGRKKHIKPLHFRI